MRRNAEKKEFLIPSDLSEVSRASARALSFLKPLALSEAAVFDIRLCLEEGLSNAMKYGNRLRREIPVRLGIEFDALAVRFEIEDRGGGFDPKRLEDCTRKANLFKGGGRGVYLIHRLMDQVRYNEKGNILTMVKVISKKRSRRVISNERSE